MNRPSIPEERTLKQRKDRKRSTSALKQLTAQPYLAVEKQARETASCVQSLAHDLDMFSVHEFEHLHCNLGATSSILLHHCL